MAGSASDDPTLAERVERLEVQNRFLKRALAVLLALTGVGILLGQHAVRGYEAHVDQLERRLEERDRERAGEPDQAPASRITAAPR